MLDCPTSSGCTPGAGCGNAALPFVSPVKVLLQSVVVLDSLELVLFVLFAIMFCASFWLFLLTLVQYLEAITKVAFE